MANESIKKSLSVLGKIIKLILNIGLPFGTFFSAVASFPIHNADAQKKERYFKCYLLAGACAIAGSGAAFVSIHETNFEWLTGFSGAPL